MSEEKKYPKIVVGAFIFNNKNELLLVKAPAWHNKYSCPGGKVELGEILEEAIIREVKEETNLDIYDIEFIDLSENAELDKIYKKEDNHLIFVNYRAKAKNIEDIKLNSEGIKYEWMQLYKWMDKKEKITKTSFNVLRQIKERQESDFESMYKRALADYHNLLKQTAKEKEEFARYANLNFIMEILPVIDNFKISVEHIPEDQRENAWVQGINYIKKQLLDILIANGIEEIKTIGEKFNPEIHEAIKNKKGGLEEKENKKDIITKEISSGYKMNGKIIRAAKVIVG